MVRFCGNQDNTFNEKKKLQQRMPRKGSHWPLALWLHCTGHYRNSVHRKSWRHTPGLQQTCIRLCSPKSLHNSLQSYWWLCRYFCFNMGFYTGLRVWRTRRIVFINTVSPALLWVTLVALDTVSYKRKQKFSFSFFCCCFFFCSFMVLVASRSRQAFSVFRRYIWEFLGNLISWNSLK